MHMGGSLEPCRHWQLVAISDAHRPRLIGITVQGCGTMAKARWYSWALGMGHMTEASSQPARGRLASATSSSLRLDAPSDESA